MNDLYRLAPHQPLDDANVRKQIIAGAFREKTNTAYMGDGKRDGNRVELTRYWHASHRTTCLGQRSVSILDHHEIHLSSAQICTGQLDREIKATMEQKWTKALTDLFDFVSIAVTRKENPSDEIFLFRVRVPQDIGPLVLSKDSFPSGFIVCLLKLLVDFHNNDTRALYNTNIQPQ